MAAESHILDGLNLADGGFVIADTPVFVPAPPRLDWVGGVDSDGTIPVDAGRSDNATLTLPLRVKQQATADLAWQKVGLLVAKLEASRRSRDGLTHLWRPKEMTSTWELTVRSGEIAEFPMNDRDAMLGYLRRMHRITIVLHCDPFLYRQGEIVEYLEVTSSDPVLSILLANVPGHVDAEAIVTVTDAATQARGHVEGGLGPNSAAPLLIDSASLVTGGFAGTATTRTGAYSANGVIRATLAPLPQAVCGTGDLGHVGAHLAKARVWASSTDVGVRLAYRTGDGDYSFTPWLTPQVGGDFCEVDFGPLTIREVTAGTQKWDGRIEAKSATVGDTLDADYIEVLPADRRWKLRSPYAYRAGVMVAYDDFGGSGPGVALHGLAAQVGGPWATAGAATDFFTADEPEPLDGDTTVVRSTTSDGGVFRRAVLGTTSYTDTEVGTGVGVGGALSAIASGPTMSVMARHIDASNHLLGYLNHEFFPGVVGGTHAWTLTIKKVVAGTATVIAYMTALHTAAIGPKSHRLRMVCFASGRASLDLLDRTSDVPLASIAVVDSALATGGALASGTPGIADSNSSGVATDRWYDNVYVAIPPAEPLVINQGRSLEIRHDSCERQSADGLTWGTVMPRGGRVYVPCAGPEAGVTRLWTKARRNDIDVVADSQVADSTKLKVAVRPRYRLPTNP